MSVLTNFVPAAVFGASLLGSAHCAGMCGGIAFSRSKSIRESVSYHGGRLAGYLTLGALAGALGAKVFSPSVAAWASWIASVSMAILFFGLAYRAWGGRAPHLRWIPPVLYSKLFKDRGAFLTGVFTAALPCGWLQSFVISAVATRSPTSGALFLFAFWLGTVPALALLPELSRRWLRPLGERAPRVSALLLVAAGVGSLVIRVHHVNAAADPNGEGSPAHSHACGHATGLAAGVVEKAK